MSVSSASPLDASALAAEVRQLARLAHRLLSDPTSDPDQIEALARKVSQLRRHAGLRKSEPVDRWLSRLERSLQVESVA
jgi:hypothetical protein